MPILETKILGSKIEISYQEGAKEKLINLVDNFNIRLSEYENLKGKFTDNKIILLAALKAEDNILDLNKKLESQKIIKKKSIDQHEQQKNIDIKVREIVNLKDQITLLNENNSVLQDENKTITNEIQTINKKLVSLIDKILSCKNDNS